MLKRPPYRHPGLVPGLIRAVIPDLFRDLLKKAVISTQPPLDVSKIPDIAGGDSGTTVLWFFKIPNIAGGDFVTTPYRHPGLVPGSI